MFTNFLPRSHAINPNNETCLVTCAVSLTCAIWLMYAQFFLRSTPQPGYKYLCVYAICVDIYILYIGNMYCSLPWQVVNGTVTNTVGYVTQYGNYILDSLRNNALRCGPLSNIYVGTMNLVCRQTVNSMVSDIHIR